jgi:hypothetical protein
MAAPKLEVAKQSEADAKESALVEDLKKQHGVSRVHVFTAETGETVYVRTPPIGAWRRFRSQMQNPTKRDEAGEVLLRGCLLSPDKNTFDAWLEERPGLLDTFASELAEVAGLSKDVEKKVL